MSVFPIGIARAEMNDIKYVNTLKEVILEEYGKYERNERLRDPSDKDYQPQWVTRGYPYQSNSLQHKREVYSKLIDFANKNVLKYLDSLGYYHDGFYTTQCWSNVYKRTKSIHPHRHYNSFLSWNF
ncbi:uncharacterized protein METZ01_LOCUS339637, partial [marine metagenome]